MIHRSRTPMFALIAATLTLVVPDLGHLSASTDPHAYFDALVNRSDFFKGYSFRPKPGASLGSVHYQNQLKAPRDGGFAHSNTEALWVTYAPESDTDLNRQDAAKVVIPAFKAIASLVDAVPPSTSGSVEIINIAWAAGFENNRALRIDNEIMVVRRASGSAPSNYVTVVRGQFGTAATAHSSGATVHYSPNSLLNQVRVPLRTADGNTYVFTWDSFYTSSYVGAGPYSHKAFQITSFQSGDQWFELQTRFAGPTSKTPNPSWNGATDVAAVTARGYSQYVAPVTSRDPLLPMADAPFIIKPNKWTRFWVVVEANREDDVTAFTNATTLASAIASGGDTTISIDHPTTIYGQPFTAATSIAGASWPGRSLRVDNEIMTIVSGTATGTVRTLTVVRGAYGTTPAPHSAGAIVQLVNDYVTMYMADEDREPVMLYNRIPMHLPINSATPSARGTMSTFWIELNASEVALMRPDLRDFVAYVRNFAVLENPSSVTPLLLRPTAGVPPPPVARPSPPGNLRIIR